jgi:hypothetical protein
MCQVKLPWWKLLWRRVWMNSKPAFHTYFSASMQLRYGHDKPMINEVCSSLSFFLSFFFGGFVSTNHPPHPGIQFSSNNLLQGVCFRTEKCQPDVHQEAVFLFMIQGKVFCSTVLWYLRWFLFQTQYSLSSSAILILLIFEPILKLDFLH